MDGVLAVMCPACSRGVNDRWPRWTSAGWSLIRSSGSRPISSPGWSSLRCDRHLHHLLSRKLLI